jgi:hypothetical protein
MSSTDESRHGIGICENCDSIQPVEVRPGGSVHAVGNPNCQCGSNEFRLVE